MKSACILHPYQDGWSEAQPITFILNASSYYLLFCRTFIPAIAGFIEAIIYLCRDDLSFRQKYIKQFLLGAVKAFEPGRSMQKLVFCGFPESFVGELFELVFLKPGHFDQQELNPYPAQEADHVFIADKNLPAKLLVANRFGSKTHDAASQLPLPKALNCLMVQLIHFARLGNDSKSRVTSFEQVYCR